MAESNNHFAALVFKNRGLLLVPVALVLFVLGQPTVLSAIIGIIVALSGEALRIWAVGYSGVTTRAEFVTAPKLVTAGPYSRMRNPLYAGNAIIALGFWIAFSGAVSIIESLVMLASTLALVTVVYAIIIPLEEQYLRRQFGAAYQHYAERVPSIIPGKPLRLKERQGKWHADVIVNAESITLFYLALMIVAIGLKLGPLAGFGLRF